MLSVVVKIEAAPSAIDESRDIWFASIDVFTRSNPECCYGIISGMPLP